MNVGVFWFWWWVSWSFANLDAQIEGLCDFEVSGKFALIPAFFYSLQGGGGDVAPPCQFPDAYALRLSFICDALADFCLCHSCKIL